jgi:hypothetical protein
MRITPLVLHGGLVIPRHTALFSDALAVTSIAVTDGGSVVITTTAPHGVAVGQQIQVSITDALTPNAITAATVNADGTVTLTTTYPHNLTTTPDPLRYDAYSTLARLAGFASAHINGNRQIVDVPDRNTVVITPGGSLTAGAIALGGSERLLETLEQEIVGWHKVTATGTSTLSFPTPAVVNRSYVVEDPVVVRSIRIWGAIDYETALAHFTASDGQLLLTRPVMFILPQPVERQGGSDIITDGADSRFMLRDGFIVLVLIPSHTTSAHVAAIDSAQGAIWRAVLRTFHGLKINRSEYADAGDYRAVFERHNGARGTGSHKAVYAHEYVFSMPAEITQCDAISPFDWSQIDDGGIADGTVPDSIYPSNPPPFRDLDLEGIYRSGEPSPMSGAFTVDAS